MKTDFHLPGFESIPDPYAEDAKAHALPAPPPPPPGPSPTRARAQALHQTALAAAIVYNVACLLWFRPHGGGRSEWTVAIGFAIPSLTALVALGAAVRPGRRGLGEPVDRIALKALAGVALFVVGTWLAAPHGKSDEAFWSETIRCVSLTSLFAAGPVAFAVVAFRRAFVAAARERTAALGVACGALGAATMAIVCADGNAVHVLVAHGIVMALMALAGAELGRRFAAA